MINKENKRSKKILQLISSLCWMLASSDSSYKRTEYDKFWVGVYEVCVHSKQKYKKENIICHL